MAKAVDLHVAQRAHDGLCIALSGSTTLCHHAKPGLLRLRQRSAVIQPSQRLVQGTVHVGHTLRGPSGQGLFRGLGKVEGVWPIRMGQPKAAASIRFCPPKGMKLPPSSAMSAA